MRTLLFNSTFIAIAFILSIQSVFAQNGPGGFEATDGTSDLELWLNADALSLTNLSPVLSWTDFSGNGRSATQASADSRPVFVDGVLNGRAVIRFDGESSGLNGDYFDNDYSGNNYIARTVFIVYSFPQIADQLNEDLGQLYGDYAGGIHIAIDSRVGNYGNFSFDGITSSTTAAAYGVNGASYGSAVETGTSPSSNFDQFDILSAEFSTAETINQQVIGALVPDFTIDEHNFQGDIAEIIVFNRTLSDPERISVENYLAAKYAIDIASEGVDYFAYQANFGGDVAGIGQEGGNSLTSVSSTSHLTLTSGAGLDTDGEFLFIGHNEGALTWSTTEVPAEGLGNIERLAREWRLDETGDVGTVTFTIDETGLPSPTAGLDTYVLLLDDDGDFSDAEIYGLDGSGEVDIDVSDGQYLSIGVIRRVIGFSNTTSADLETVNAPSITISANYRPQSSISVDYATSDNGATGGTTPFSGGTDYETITTTAATITAGNLSTSFNLNINNDSDQESSEGIDINLSNPTAGHTLINNPFTYTINDDDNPRKIYFNSATYAVNESGGSVAVRMNLTPAFVDPSNSTTADYTISGSATGGGSDYTLSNGTITIPPNNVYAELSVPITDDALFESSETIILTLSNPTNGSLSGTNPIVTTITITDNDPQPQVQFNVTTSSFTEQNGSVNVSVVLSSVAGDDITVDFSATGGTATGSGEDYSLVAGELTIPAGDIFNNISVTLFEDVEPEDNETIIIGLSNPQNATLGTNTSHTLTITDDDGDYGSEGPGGVGSSNSLSLWLKADDISGVTSGNALTVDWEDASGNGNDATVSAGGLQPTYYDGASGNNINGFPVVRFDGIDDELVDSHTYNAHSFFGVYRVVTGIQETTDLGQIWGAYDDEVHVALDARNIGNLQGYSFDGSASGGNTARYGLNGAAYSSFVENDNSTPWSYDAAELVTVEFGNQRTPTVQEIGFTTGTNYFGGDIAELIVFPFNVNTARRRIVENYLGAKYSITIANDYFAFEGTHNYDVAGLGQESDGGHEDAESANIIRINSVSLDNGEYLLFGHDNGAVSWSGTEVPADSLQRITREWVLDVTGTITDGTVIIDPIDLDALPTDFGGYVLLVDDNGDFSDGGTTQYELTQNGSVYEVSGVDLSNDQYMTIATIGITAEMTILSASQSETISTYDIGVTLSRASASNTDISFVVDGGSTATEGGGSDFTIEASPITINSGLTSGTITITVNNDSDVELSETVIVNLTSADNNVEIGSSSQFTLTIQDDDASSASGSGPGSVKTPGDFAFWLKADSAVYNDEPASVLASDGELVAIWDDLSGNGNQADSLDNAPTYRDNGTDNRNGKPVIDFSVGDNILTIANANDINGTTSTEKTLVVAFETGSDVTSRQVIYEQGGGSNGLNVYIESGSVYIAVWDNDWTGTFLSRSSSVIANTGYIAYMEIDIPTSTVNYYLNAVDLTGQTIAGAGSGDFDAHVGLIGVGGMLNASYFSGGADSGVEDYYFDGNILELLEITGDNPGEAEKVILQNYLAGKWNINISGSGDDIFSYKTTHSYDVAGVGQASSTDYHLAAQTTEFVEISNPTGLDDGDYLIFGHDNGDVDDFVSSEVPSTNFERLAREWRISEAGDITGVKVTLDTTQLNAARSAEFNEYVLLIDSDGDFSTGASVYAMTQNVGQFEVSDIDFADGDYFTFAAMRPTVQFVPATANGSESVTPVNLVAQLNYALTSQVTVDYTLNVGNSTATEGPVADFTLTDGTFTFDVGETSASVEITIVDDFVIEGSEVFEIDLENPSSDLFIADDTTFTYTINDNDITTQVDFSVSSSSISENAGSANVTIKLSQIDGADVNVDYTVTASTATGGGVDYTLADGTATITAGNLNTAILISLVNDDLLENAETVTIELSNPVNASLGSNTIHTVTINDDDAAPEIAFSTASSSGSEGQTPANILVSLSEVSGLDATVDYEVVVANTTAGGSDYSLSNGSLTISAGDTESIISIIINDDTEIEVSETIELRLFDNGNLNNTTIGEVDTTVYIINDNDEFGFDGPGGVRAASDYLYWLRADKTVYQDTSANTVATNNTIAQGWVDYSGNGNDAFGNSGAEPVYKNNISDNVNLKPIIDFASGSSNMTIVNANDINALGPFTNKTIVAAFQLSSETEDRQVVYEQGGGTNGFSIYIYEDSVFLAAWENIGTGVDETFDTLSAPVIGGQTVIAILDYNATDLEFNGYIGGVGQGTKAVVADGIPTHTGSIDIGYTTGAAIHGSGGTNFEGKIMELFSFNGNYSQSQRIILENYLAAKYNANITASGNDFFNYQGVHSYGVAGLGRVNSTDFKTVAQSDSLITISSASNLGDGEFLIFGHDNGGISTYVTTDAPSNMQRIEREWRLTETGNVGTITFVFDTTNVAASPSANYTQRALLIDADGNFASGATIVPLTRVGSTYEASNVDFSDGDYFTFAVIRPEVEFEFASSNDTEDTTPVNISINLNYPLAEDLDVTVNQTGGTATDPDDYSFTDGIRTITAGSTSTTAEITIVNDAEVESDETVILTLSSPSVGQLGTNTQHTYSINDDDNFRKANFYRSDSTDTEGETIQGIYVFLNAPDNTNPTEVYVEVTNGTAQNDSIDFYVQARDTLFFAASDTVELLPINIIDDLIDENDETIEISIVGGTNTTIGDTTVFTYTIIDDDAAPTVQFTSATQSGDESFQTVDLAIELSAVSGKDITLDFSATGGTAVENTDFQFLSTQIIIPAGTTTDSLQFVVIDDGIEEVPDETIEISISDPSPEATLGANSTITYTVLDNDGAGYEGPGGVGNLDAQTALWFRADDTNSGFSNGVAVSLWEDQTNNNNDGFQAAAGERPIYQENLMNNRPALVFDGANDLIEIATNDDINNAGPYDKKTIMLAFRTGTDVTTRQMLYEEGGGVRGLSIYILNDELYIGGWNQNDDDGGATTPWPQTTPPYTINIQQAISANTNYFVTLQYDFDVAGASFNGDVRASINGQALQELSGGGRLFTHPDVIGLGAVNGGTVYHDLSSSAGPDPFSGNISELLVTNIVYNEAQRRIVYNYLAAKYDIDISTEDVFAYEATHSYDIVGLGRTDAANPHNDAQGTGIVRINNPSNLGDNEFLLIGHDNGGITSWSSTDLPDNNSADFRRVAREWRADETGDIGNITVTIDDSFFAAPPAGFPTNYVLMVDDDGNFTSGAEIYQLEDQGGGLFAVDNIDLTGDRYFTIGLAQGIVQFSSATANSLEDDSPESVEVSLNYITGETFTVDYTVTDGTAEGSGVDYTLASGTLTFNSGEQTRNLTVNLTNDVEVESDETFTITLSNPSGTVDLGTNDVLTFTINDSDILRKVNLANSDSANTEDQSPILLEVFLSERDDVNPTEVYYTVSGTATNGASEDFDLTTPGTVMFAVSDTLETISIPINDDGIDENDETVIITLVGGQNAGLGDTLVFTYTIQDNDDAPEISFDAAASSGSEGATSVSIPISLSTVSANDVSINYALNGATTATSGGGDFNLVGSSTTITAGNTTGSINFTVFNDGISEVDETIVIDISSPTNATLVAPTQHTYTIIDDDGGLGPIGPGGVGKSLSGSEMVIWLNASTGVFSDSLATTTATDGSDVGNWLDQSTFENHATDTIGFSTYPNYVTSAVSGQPGIDYNSANSDKLTILNDALINTDADGYALKSITLAFEASSDVTSRQMIYEQGGGSNGLNIWIESGVLNFGAWSVTNGWDYISVTNAVSANDLVVATFEMDQGAGEIRAFGYINGTPFTGTTSGVTGLLNAHSGLIGVGAMINDSKITTGSTLSGNNHFFDGTLLELVQYNERNIHSFHRKLLASYYDGKYGAGADDSYDIFNDTKDATFNLDIFGIGQDSSAARHLIARSPSQLLQIDNATGIVDTEYLLIGHDNGGIGSYSDTEIFTGLMGFVERIDREWIVEESGEIGDFRFQVDTTLLPANPSGFEEYFLIVDNDNDADFTDDADGALTFYRLYDRFGNYALSDTVNLDEGDVFTLGMAINTAIATGDWDDASVWLLGVPEEDEPVTIVSPNVITLVSDITVSDLTINSGATLDLATFTLTVNDSLNMNGTFVPNTGTVDYASNSGNVCVEPLTYYNLTISGSGTKTLCGDVLVTNDLQINNNPVLDTDGINNYDIELQGNWTSAISSTFSGNTGLVSFTGSSAQNIAKTGSPETFTRMEINKPAEDVTITNGGVDISQSLTMTSGDLILGTYDLTISTTASTGILGGGAGSYVQADGSGVVAWDITNGNSYVFPIGDGSGGYSPFTFSPTSLTSSGSPSVNLNVVPSVNGNILVSSAHITRYWNLNQSNITSSQFNIAFQYEDTDVAGGAEADLVPIKFNIDADTSDFTSYGLDDVTNTITWNALTSFSEITAGEESSPLPVELIHFDAKLSGEKVLLEWITANEFDNDYFEIQKSTDGKNFLNIGEVEGNGTSTEQHEYQFTDPNPLFGFNYYRLKQVDFDGAFEYSPIRVVMNENHQVSFSVNLYPNPTNPENIGIGLTTGDETSPILVKIYDATGRTYFSEEFNPGDFFNRITLNMREIMPAGFYHVVVKQGEDISNNKLIIE